MADPLIWTCDDIVRFTREPDFFDRAWAWEWLHRHHRAVASEQAARAIRDESPSVACTGIHIFASAPTAEAREAIEELGRRADLDPTLREELELLEHPQRRRKIDDPISDAIDRLSLQRDELRREAPAMLRSRRLDPQLVALGALGNQQHQWATDILLDALPVLLTAGDPSIVWDTFDQLRDPRALPALAATWVPGERYVAALYARIHRLAGSGEPLPAGIARDVEEEAKRKEAREALRERDPAEAKLGARRLQIRCTACGRTGDYDVAPEALATVLRFDGAEKKGERIPAETVVACKHCGVKNAYEVNAFSRISAEGGLRALEASRRRGERAN
jgi:hypothetical protein